MRSCSLISIANPKTSIPLAGVVPLTEEERAEERERRQERRLGATVESSDDEGKAYTRHAD